MDTDERQEIGFKKPRIQRKTMVAFRISPDLKMHLEEAAELHGLSGINEEALFRLQQSYKRDTLEQTVVRLEKLARRLENLAKASEAKS